MTKPESVSLPFVTSRVVVISDFNCPYCFTLNEWIHSLGLSDRVRWLGIEHRPDLPTDGPNRDEDILQLEDEVIDVQLRAPDVAVQRPAVWPNSRAALLIQNAIEDDEPERAPEIRRQIFLGIWSSSDSANLEKVVERSLADFDLDTPEVEPQWLEELTSWWQSNLDRIPCMIAPTGVVHRGLQDRDAVTSFLNSALRAGRAGPGCT